MFLKEMFDVIFTLVVRSPTLQVHSYAHQSLSRTFMDLTNRYIKYIRRDP